LISIKACAVDGASHSAPALFMACNLLQKDFIICLVIFFLLFVNVCLWQQMYSDYLHPFALLHPLQCVTLDECAADDASGCCEVDSKRECRQNSSCRWDGKSEMCRGTVREPIPCVDLKIATADGSGEDWSDLDNDTCETYRQSMWCGTQPDGTGGVGWGWRPGDKFSDFTDPFTGLHAGQVCCRCGGGDDTGKQLNVTPIATKPASSVTSTVKPTNTAPAPTQITARKPVCKDRVFWTDNDGDTCGDYADRAWCGVGDDGTSFSYGPGWGDDSLMFEDYVGTNALHAGQACCACGGGDMV
jgi:hypothetical protein